MPPEKTFTLVIVVGAPAYDVANHRVSVLSAKLIDSSHLPPVVICRPI
jgi:hypothetical protein